MTTIYEWYKVWLPWHWIPYILFWAIMYTGAGVFFLERKVKVTLAMTAGSSVSRRSWVPVTRSAGSRPTEVVEVFASTRPAITEEVKEVEEAKEALKVRVRARR